MAMNHDNQGFLVGERLDADDITGRLDGIREEIRALRRDLSETRSGAGPQAPSAGASEGASSAAMTPSPARAAPRRNVEARRDAVIRIEQPAVATPAGRQGLGRYVYRTAETETTTLRDQSGGSGGAHQAPSALPANPQGVEKPRVAPESPVATPQRGRDESGRFATRGATASPGRDLSETRSGAGPQAPSAGSGSAAEGEEPGMMRRSIDGLGDRLGGAVREVGAGTEEADPAVKALNEVAQPMQRGFAMLSSGGENRKQDRWYRRFWRMMRRSRRSEQTEGKRQRRILKNIERKPVGDGSGSMLWRGLMLLLAPITGMLSLLGGLPVALAGALAAALRPILRALGLNSLARRVSPGGGGGRRNASRRAPAASAAGRNDGRASSQASRQTSNAGGNAGRNAGRGGWMRKLGRAAKGGARRIPLIGGLISAGFMASDVMASESSDATRAEKDRRTGGAVGSGLGGIGGMAAGASAGAAIGSIVPGLGTAIGGVIGAAAGGFFGGSAGEVVGETVGGWVTDLRKSNLVRGITQRWEYATTFMGSIWEQASAGISAKWDAVSETVEGLWGDAKSAVTARWDSVTGKMQDHWDTAVSIAAKGWESLTDAMSSANDWIKDKTGIDVAQKAGEAKEWVSGKAADAAEVVSDAGSRVRDGAVDLGNKVKGEAGKAYDKAADAVSGAASDAGDAVVSFWGSVKDKASDMKEGVTDAVASSAPARAARKAHNEASAEPALNQAMADAGITDPNEQAAFMGQMSHESGGFRTMEESFNYSSADRIMSVSKTARGQGKDAVKAAMAQGPEAVANMMYGGREDLGNTEKGDGYRFRGRGYTQLTGRDNYQRTGDALGIDLVNNPDMAKDPEIAAKIATHYWQSRSGLSDAAKKGDTREVTRLINGGANGLADRKARTDEYLTAARAGELDVSIPTVAASDEPAAPKAPTVATTATPSASPAAAPVGVPAVATASVTAPRMPEITEVPAVSAPLNSPASQGERRPTASGGSDVSRDVSDRRIAHIVTGSYGGMG